MDASSICTPCKVKLAVSHHSMNAAHDEITVDKPLVFVVEPPKDVTQEDETQKKTEEEEQAVQAGCQHEHLWQWAVDFQVQDQHTFHHWVPL